MTGKHPEPIAFARLGQPVAETPLVLAVPHAGRHYPAEMLAASRLPRHALETIEDRHADLLVQDAVCAGAVAIVAGMARAYVDLNRDEREIDPAILKVPPPPGGALTTAKVTGGLGAIPSRIAAGGSLWRHPLDPADVARRFERVHRPYHQALAEALSDARARHGIAILIDCHSMPPLGGPHPPRIVIGDLYGRSASQRFTATAMAAVEQAGLRGARNAPYAGGFTLARHGRPLDGIHALQVEIDRTLYLDPRQRQPGDGLGAIRTLLATITAALIADAGGLALAAE